LIPLGLWVDDAPGVALASLDDYRELGIDTIAVMVESSRSSWDPTWTISQITRLQQRAVELGIEVVLTTWPSPRRAYLDAMASWLAQAVPYGAAGIEVDLEGQWGRNDLDGSLSSLSEAAALLLLKLRDLAGAHDLRLEVTTHPGHMESSPSALVVPHVDRIVAQAYSIRRRPSGEIIEWADKRYGPGRHQKWAAADARTVPAVGAGHVGLSLGIAAWSQAWPGHEPHEALDRAYQAAVAEDPAEIRLWSSKWVTGAHATPYGRRWLAGLERA
jgi:hypothetical protein